MVKILLNELDICCENVVIINIIWALNNISSTGSEFRNEIAKLNPNIFKQLLKIISLNSIDNNLHFEAVYFTQSMIMHEQFEPDSFLETY